MENYKPNSNRFKEEQTAIANKKERVQKVVSGPVQVRKKNGFDKMRDAFVQEDLSKVKDYILLDVIVPGIKKAIVEAVNAFVYGGGNGNRNTSSPVSKVSYRSFYNNPVSTGNSGVMNHSARTTYSYDEISFPNKGDAELVLDTLVDLIATYGQATVADFYDLVGQTGNYTDQNYGWTDLSEASTIRVRDGYVIKFPRAVPIKQ